MIAYPHPVSPGPAGVPMTPQEIVNLLGITSLFLMMSWQWLKRYELRSQAIQEVENFLLDPDANLRQEFEKLEREVSERRK